MFNFFRDSLTSLVSKMGTERDKSATVYYPIPVLNTDQIENAYRGTWLARKIIDIPAKDSCREWRDWQANKDVIEKLEAEEARLDVRGKVMEARIKSRLYGGAVIMIGTGESDLTKPLNVERIGIGGIKYLTVLDQNELSCEEIQRDPASTYFGQPEFFKLTSNTGFLRIHSSRFIHFSGNNNRAMVRNFDQNYWGDSVLLSIIDAIKNADSTAGNIAALIFEAKIDVIRIPNFMANLSDLKYRETLLTRYTLANTSKGINGTLLLDKEEEFETKTPNLSGLTDILMAFLQIVSGASDIPMTRLLGQSPAGMSATGESDYRNYLDSISSDQELYMTPALAVFDECLIRSATGKRDPSIYYEWSPLWHLSEKDRSEIDARDATTSKTYLDSGLIPGAVLAEAVINKLIENGTYPGLEAAVEAYGKENIVAEVEGDLEEKEANELALKKEKAKALATDATPQSLYVHRKLLNAAEVIAWAKSQGFETTLPADDMHVTIAFSRAEVDWMKIGESWNGNSDGTFDVNPGGARMVEEFGGGAIVLLFSSSALSYRHESMKYAGASWDWPEYQPHITLTYKKGSIDLRKVSPYKGKLKFGPEIFEKVNEDWKTGVKEEA